LQARQVLNGSVAMRVRRRSPGKLHRRRSTGTDRAFRALGQIKPQALLQLVRIFAPDLIPARAYTTPAQVDDPHLPTHKCVIAADWISRIARMELLHMEAQGYRDKLFLNRTFKYHVHFVVRYPGYRVRTVALWLIEPPQAQRLEVIRRGSLQLSIRSLVLARLPAARMLRHPLLACFAAGADPGEWTAAELCQRVAAGLQRGNATEEEIEFALVAAAIRGRYKEMVKAMRSERTRPALSIDLSRYLEDVGYEKGRKHGTRDGLKRGVQRGLKQGLKRGVQQGLKRGLLQGMRNALLNALGARRMKLTGADRKRIASASAARLERWLVRAVTVNDAASVFLTK
jgi:hypothetical protein